MERSVQIVSAIVSLGYPRGGRCLLRCGCDELPCPLLNWLSAELRTLCPELTDLRGAGDVLLVEELRNLMSNMFSPFAVMTDVLEPFALNRITDFLVSELLAAHVIKEKEMHPKENLTREEAPVKEQRVEHYSYDDGSLCEECEDGDAADTEKRKAEMQAEWIPLLHALGLDASSQFEDVENEVKSRLVCLPDGDMTNPLLKTSLSSEQWTQLQKINQTLSVDYQCRQQMMIKRFQVTLESFAWGEKQKERRAVLDSVPSLVSLTGSSQVSPSLLLAAREDQSFIEPIKAGKSTAVYKMLMGSVPDRGGRPGEIEPPMPTWGERRAEGKGGGRGGGHQQRYRKKKGKKE
ncbi:protein FAM98B [Poecilia latipinna]|uniref:Im:7138535 n=1 Tax=Poecilia latipinna TaxID=48699 RepID=A0A3B3V3K0_9TELE|nr:PREDICTED: protein FAM98B-like [Poecilia latipinna]